jgi:hypothetical protein
MLYTEQVNAVVLAGVFCQCSCIALYLQFTRTAAVLEDDFCYGLQPWGLLLAIVVGLTFPTAWLNSKLLKAKDKLKMGKVSYYTHIYRWSNVLMMRYINSTATQFF